MLNVVLSLAAAQIDLHTCLNSNIGVSFVGPEVAYSAAVLGRAQIAILRTPSPSAVFVTIDGHVSTSDSFPEYGVSLPGDTWSLPLGDGGYEDRQLEFTDAGVRLSPLGSDVCKPQPHGGLCLPDNSRLETEEPNVKRIWPNKRESVARLLRAPIVEHNERTTAVVVDGDDFKKLIQNPDWSDIIIPSPEKFELHLFKCATRYCWAVGQGGEVAKYNRKLRTWTIRAKLQPGFSIQSLEFGGEEHSFLFDPRCPRLMIVR